MLLTAYLTVKRGQKEWTTNPHGSSRMRRGGTTEYTEKHGMGRREQASLFFAVGIPFRRQHQFVDEFFDGPQLCWAGIRVVFDDLSLSFFEDRRVSG